MARAERVTTSLARRRRWRATIIAARGWSGGPAPAGPARASTAPVQPYAWTARRPAPPRTAPADGSRCAARPPAPCVHKGDSRLELIGATRLVRVMAVGVCPLARGVSFACVQREVTGGGRALDVLRVLEQPHPWIRHAWQVRLATPPVRQLAMGGGGAAKRLL